MNPEEAFYKDLASRAMLRTAIGEHATRQAFQHNSDPELQSMFYLGTKLAPTLSIDSRLHLRKMMAAHLEFVTRPRSKARVTDYARTLVAIELRELRRFNEDLKDMPEIWQAAFEDMATLQQAQLQ